ncbi:MAG: hypothetical protein DME50_17470 [Verrucomicrobia bacterium]|nr:MAG: hypothetical protein DME50_17470 [Verrucomicrobiota bacterium]
MQQLLYFRGSPVAPLFKWRIPAQRNQRTDNNYFNQQSHTKAQGSQNIARYRVGRSRGVGRGRGVGLGLPDGVGVAVGVGVGVATGQLPLTLNTMCMFGKSRSAKSVGSDGPQSTELR